MPVSELRFDLVSKDWVVIATGRAKRLDAFVKKNQDQQSTEKKDIACPFCQIKTQGLPVLVKTKDRKNIKIKDISELKNIDWATVVVPNKYPAFTEGESLNERAVGPYQVMDGMGHHEVIVHRDHNHHTSQFSLEEWMDLIDIMQQRYLALMDKGFINYISIFHNHGAEAGASIVHPHSQIIAMPVTDPDLRRSLEGSYRYFELHHKCVHCVMIEWDLSDGQRIIFENEKFVVLCPFTPRVSFELRIYPKEHKSYFERITDDEIMPLAEALHQAMTCLDQRLNDPAYNFFVHTAPCDGKNYDHYHWHFEILPKTSTWAGFELGTGIEISTILPEEAAKFLRE